MNNNNNNVIYGLDNYIIYVRITHFIFYLQFHMPYCNIVRNAH